MLDFFLLHLAQQPKPQSQFPGHDVLFKLGSCGSFGPSLIDFCLNISSSLYLIVDINLCCCQNYPLFTQ